MEISVSQQLEDLWRMTIALEIQAKQEANRAYLAFQKEKNGKLSETWNWVNVANYNHKRTKQLMAAFEYGTQRKKMCHYQISKPTSAVTRFWSPQEVQHLIACARKMIGVGAFYTELYKLFKLRPTRRSFEAVRKKAQRLGICPAM